MSNDSRPPAPETWLRYVVRHPVHVIIGTLLITLVFAWQLPRLRFQSSIYDMAIEDLAETRIYTEFKKQYGSEEIILVVAKAENFFDPATFESLDRLAAELSKIKGVGRVVSLPGIKKTMDLTGRRSLEEFERIIRPAALLERNLISKDRRTTAVSLILEDASDRQLVIDEVRRVISGQPAGLRLYQIGMPNVSEALAKFTEQDFSRLPPIAFAVIALVLFLSFKTLRGVLIPTGSVLIGLIWTFGLMAWTGTPLSMLTMIVPVFLIAVGTAYCVYSFPEYHAAAEKTDSPREAAFQCFSRVGLPTGLAVITTVVGLGSLLLNRIPAIRAFALFSCFGILAMLAIIMSFLPAVMSLVPLPPKKAAAARPGMVDRILEGIVRFSLNRRKTAYLLFGIAAIAGLLGMTRLRVETNPVDFFKKDTEVSRQFHDVYRDLAGSFPVNVDLISGKDDYFEDPAHLAFVVQVQKFLDTLPGVDKTISFADYLMLVNYAVNQYKEESYALPEEKLEVRMLVNSYKTMLGQDMLARFMDANFSRTNIMMRTHLSSSRDFLALQAAVEAYLRENAPKALAFHTTGFGVVISQSSHILAEGQAKSLLLTLILIFCAMFALFISYKVGLIAMVPACFPIVVNFGTMGWLGIPLSSATSLIACIAIGLAVDDTIHYLVRYNREFKKDLDKARSLRDSVLQMGRPMIFTSVTIALGFSVLMASNFKPTAIFGVLMAITMGSALIADLVLLPSLMLHVELVTVWDLLRLKMGRDPREGIPLFQGLSRTQVHYILMAGALRRYEAGETVMRKGETSDSMYAIISGELEVMDVTGGSSADDAAGIKRLITTLSAGHVVGEMGMIRSCERSATVIASAPSELLRINDRMIKRLQWLYPPTAQKFFFNLMAHLCNRLQAMNQVFLQASTVDSCTGLSTCDHMMDILGREIARARRFGIPLSFFLLQLEGFPEVSRRHGARGASRVLEAAGKLVADSVRDTDYLCRYDAERFGGILTHTAGEEAREICGQIQKRITGYGFRHDGAEISLKAVVGIADMAAGSTRDRQSLVRDAWDALDASRQPGAAPVQLKVEGGRQKV